MVPPPDVPDTVAPVGAEPHAGVETVGPRHTSASDPDSTVGTPFARELHPAAHPSPVVGRYVLGAELARGGMGVVYRATDTTLGREVAVKVLQQGLEGSEDAATRFEEEARITAQLQHPAIPPVHDLGTLPDGRLYLAMKLIAGQTLHQLLDARPDASADRDRYLAVFERICQAVAYAQSRGVLHRDLKPANVMVGGFGEVQVMDWGLAKSRSGPTAGPTSVRSYSSVPTVSDEAAVETLLPTRDSTDDRTQYGRAMGTPAYMPPEQATGDWDRLGPWSDVFALGGILCAILTGSPPYAGTSSLEVMSRAAAADLGDARARLAGCGADPGVIDIAVRCLAAEPANRPADAEAVAALVANFRQGVAERLQAAETARAAADAKAVEQRKRRKVLIALGLVLGFGVAVAWLQDRRAAARRTELAVVQGEKQAAELLQRAKDETAEADNRKALAEEVQRCETALRADALETAASALAEIVRRETLPGTEPFRDRIARCRRDLAMLDRLDRVETFCWTLVNQQFPPATEVDVKWHAAFAPYGIIFGSTPPAEVAGRLADSLIRERLLLTLDQWHVSLTVPGIAEVLHEADPDPLRDAIRAAVTAQDWKLVEKRIEELLRGPAMRDLPPRYAIALGGGVAQHLFVSAAQAREVLTAVWDRAPGNVRVLMALGRTYPLNQLDGAQERVRWFQAAVAVRPGQLIAWLHLGVALTNCGQYDEAVAAFRECLRLDPRSGNAWLNRGIALRKKGDLDGAIAAYRQALALEPESTRHYILNNLGNALGDKDDLDGAIEYFEKALKLDPKFATAHANLGNALLRQGNPDAAIPCFRNAIALDANYPQAHVGLAKSLFLKRDGEGALAEFRTALRLDPKSWEAHTGVGHLLARSDPDEAIAAYREAIRWNPNVPDPHDHLGLLLQDKRDWKGAVAEFREAIRLDPKSTRWRYNLGIALRKSGDMKGAIVAYRELLAIDPKHVNARTNLAFVLDNTEDLDGAIAEYREVLRIVPNHATAKANLASVLEEKARRDRIAPPPREVKE